MSSFYASSSSHHLHHERLGLWTGAFSTFLNNVFLFSHFYNTSFYPQVWRWASQDQLWLQLAGQVCHWAIDLYSCCKMSSQRAGTIRLLWMLRILGHDFHDGQLQIDCLWKPRLTRSTLTIHFLWMQNEHDQYWSWPGLSSQLLDHGGSTQKCLKVPTCPASVWWRFVGSKL